MTTLPSAQGVAAPDPGAPVPSGSVRLGAWMETWWGEAVAQMRVSLGASALHPFATRDALVSSGITDEDIAAHRRATGWLTVEQSRTELLHDLLDLAVTAPGVSLRAGLGWVFVTCERGDCADLARRWRDWHQVDPEFGWLLFAAGMGPVEARDTIEAGPVDVLAWAGVAALLGRTVPPWATAG